MKKNTGLIAYILLALALIVWAGVVLFSWNISAQEQDRMTAVQNAQQSSDQQSSSVRIHAIAQDTASERSALDGVLSADVVSITNMLDAAGQAAGVSLTVGGALPESAQDSASPTASVLPVEAVGFALSADGTFPQLMRAAQLLETLPLPSSIERLDIQKNQSSAAAADTSWQMSIYLRVLTTSDVSS